MQVEFYVSNFRSIKDSATLSMVASDADNELEATNVLQSSDKRLKLLASAVVYGPNASGKSTLLRAIRKMRSIVIKQRQRGDEIEVHPYVFDVIAANRKTEFEVIFVTGGVRYQYGFAAIKKKIISEWLYAFQKSGHKLGLQEIGPKRLKNTIQASVRGSRARGQCGLRRQMRMRFCSLRPFS